MSDDDSPRAGDVLELEVGPAAHGGFCVARHRGQVVFVRHAIPGERVRATVTDTSHATFLRADAVEVVVASPDRVVPPCPYAGPGRCGGCDWQHVSASRQRELKADVVREQFRRLAKVDLDEDFAVEPLSESLLGWRTRIAFAADDDGRLGLHRHHARTVELVERCLIGVAGVGDSEVLTRSWPGVSGIEVAQGDDGEIAVLARRPGPGRQARGRRPPDRVELIDGPDHLVRRVGERDLAVAADGFWQVHPDAVDAFADAVIALVQPTTGETVLDLYCGAGALTVALAGAVGDAGQVIGIESNARAVSDAESNLAGLSQARVRRGRVDAALLAHLDVRPDVVVLDPPRAGAGRDVMHAIVQLAPRAIGYVACDPAALARDTRAALDAGWALSGIRAFDAFPMTHHVECVAALRPA